MAADGKIESATKADELTITRRCELLGINRTGVYCERRPPAPEKVENEERIKSRIDHWHQKHPYMGVRKIKEKFLNNDDYNVPHLIKAAIAHYQFETIHPFLDGNGRVGRLIIPLYLLAKGIISKPCFYISDYFERNREYFYDGLDKPRMDNDLTHWVKFFLSATIDTAVSAKDKFSNSVQVVQELNKRAATIRGRTENVHAILDAFYIDPILDVNRICLRTELTQRTVLNIVDDMQRNGVIEETTGLSRNRVYMISAYIDAFK